MTIITDGEENDSQEYDRFRVNQMIEKQRSQFNWEFLYQGASLEQVEFAKTLGITKSTQYVQSQEGFRTAYASMGKETMGLRDD